VLPDGIFFIPKIPTWVYFRGSWNVKCWSILSSFGVCYGNLVYFIAVWYIWWSFDIFFPDLVYLTKNNLAALVGSRAYTAKKKLKWRFLSKTKIAVFTKN
jgi:hypothetical protein